MSDLCSTDPNFLMQFWDQLLHQAKDTLNMLCIAQDDPSKLAYKMLHGNHNFNAQPWKPPGCKAIVQEHLQSCISWGPRGTDKWYIGSAKDHHQCYCMYIIDIKKYQLWKGVTFQTKFCYIPKVQPRDYTVQVAEERLTEFVKLNNGKAQEPLKHLQAFSTMKQDFQRHNWCSNYGGDQPSYAHHANCVTFAYSQRHSENNTENSLATNPQQYSNFTHNTSSHTNWYSVRTQTITTGTIKYHYPRGIQTPTSINFLQHQVWCNSQEQIQLPSQPPTNNHFASYKHFANLAIHSETGETITSYKKLVTDPLNIETRPKSHQCTRNKHCLLPWPQGNQKYTHQQEYHICTHHVGLQNTETWSKKSEKYCGRNPHWISIWSHNACKRPYHSPNPVEQCHQYPSC